MNMFSKKIFQTYLSWQPQHSAWIDQLQRWLWRCPGVRRTTICSWSHLAPPQQLERQLTHVILLVSGRTYLWKCTWWWRAGLGLASADIGCGRCRGGRCCNRGWPRRILQSGRCWKSCRRALSWKVWEDGLASASYLFQINQNVFTCIFLERADHWPWSWGWSFKTELCRLSHLSAVSPLAQRTLPLGVVIQRVTFSSMSNSRSRGFSLKKSVERLNSDCSSPAGKTDSQPTGILHKERSNLKRFVI